MKLIKLKNSIIFHQKSIEQSGLEANITRIENQNNEATNAINNDFSANLPFLIKFLLPSPNLGLQAGVI